MIKKFSFFDLAKNNLLINLKKTLNFVTGSAIKAIKTIITEVIPPTSPIIPNIV